MPSFPHLITDLDRAKGGLPLAHHPDAAALVASFEFHAGRIQQRLTEIRTFLRMDHPSEAVRRSLIDGDLVQAVRQLRELPWPQQSAFTPEALDVGALAALEQARSREKDLGKLLAAWRTDNLLRRPVKARLRLARTLAAKDGASGVWADQIRDLESVRVQEIQVEVAQAEAAGQADALQALLDEVSDKAWIGQPPAGLAARLANRLTTVRQGDRQRLAEEAEERLLTAFRAGDAAAALAMDGSALPASHGDADTAAVYAQATYWRADLVRRDQATRILLRAETETDPHAALDQLADIQRIMQGTGRLHAQREQRLEEWINRAMADERRARIRARSLRWGSLAAGAAVTVALAGWGVSAMIDSHRMAAAGQNLEALIAHGDHAQAAQQLAALETADPAIVQAPWYPEITRTLVAERDRRARFSADLTALRARPAASAQSGIGLLRSAARNPAELRAVEDLEAELRTRLHQEKGQQQQTLLADLARIRALVEQTPQSDDPVPTLESRLNEWSSQVEAIRRTPGLSPGSPVEAAALQVLEQVPVARASLRDRERSDHAVATAREDLIRAVHDDDLSAWLAAARTIAAGRHGDPLAVGLRTIIADHGLAVDGLASTWAAYQDGAGMAFGGSQAAAQDWPVIGGAMGADAVAERLGALMESQPRSPWRSVWADLAAHAKRAKSVFDTGIDGATIHPRLLEILDDQLVQGIQRVRITNKTWYVPRGAEFHEAPGDARQQLLGVILKPADLDTPQDILVPKGRYPIEDPPFRRIAEAMRESMAGPLQKVPWEIRPWLVAAIALDPRYDGAETLPRAWLLRSALDLGRSHAWPVGSSSTWSAYADLVVAGRVTGQWLDPDQVNDPRFKAMEQEWRDLFRRAPPLAAARDDLQRWRRSVQAAVGPRRMVGMIWPDERGYRLMSQRGAGRITVATASGWRVVGQFREGVLKLDAGNLPPGMPLFLEPAP